MTMQAGNFASKLPFTLNETVEVSPGKRKYKEIGKVDMPFPTLADFGIQAEIAKDDKGADKMEDGVPVYAVEALDWLQFAIVQQLKAQNRNKFVEGKLKDGTKLPENFVELVTVGERSGEALKARHECRIAFANHLKAANKSEAVAKLLSDLLTDADTIRVCQDKFANALEANLAVWIPTLSEELKSRYGKTLEKAAEALENRNLVLEGF